MNGEILNNYPSFGRYPKLKPSDVELLLWQHQKINSSNILPRGFGRSYGDSCLNENGTLIDTTQLNHLISFDENTGILKAEAGIQFKDIIEFINKTTGINEKINKDKLKNAVNSTLFDKLKSSEEKNGFSEAITSKKSNKKIPFFYLGPKNDWKKILDDELKNKLNDIELIEVKED